MKKRYILGGTLVLLGVMLASVGLAAALTEYYPALEIKYNGMVWYFKTYDDTNGAFNGLKIIKSSIVAYCWDNDGNFYYLHPAAIVKTKNWVMLIFCPKSLPKVEIAGSTVTGELTNGDTFVASGPGFTWGRH
jgi:hypothetical protein